MKGKAFAIGNHLFKLSDKGVFFQLNGNGVWVQLSTKELYKLIK